jgi:hypothetical protein
MFEYDKLINEVYETATPIIVSYDEKYFKLPIEYNKPREINSIIKEDIELNEKNHIYKFLLNDSFLKNKWSSYYTTNKQFIKDTQLHIKYFTPSITKDNDMFTDYKSFKEETNFMDKYQYLNIKMFKSFNNYSIFLHFLGFFNLASPALSLLSPLLALILPFVIFKIKGIPISLTTYCSLIKKMITDNNFFKIFTNFSNMPTQQKMSGIISIFFYIFQIYTNIMSCIHFYTNLHAISEFLFKFKRHLSNSIALSNKIQSSIQKYETYTPFYSDIEKHKTHMIRLYNDIDILLPYENTFAKLTQLGVYMKLYYDI